MSPPWKDPLCVRTSTEALCLSLDFCKADSFCSKQNFKPWIRPDSPPSCSTDAHIRLLRTAMYACIHEYTRYLHKCIRTRPSPGTPYNLQAYRKDTNVQIHVYTCISLSACAIQRRQASYWTYSQVHGGYTRLTGINQIFFFPQVLSLAFFLSSWKSPFWSQLLRCTYT